MNRRCYGFVLCVLILCAFLCGCEDDSYSPDGPVPEALLTPALVDFTQEAVDNAVTTTLEEIYSPAPAENGAPPSACDYVRFLRARPTQDYSGKAVDADACFLLVPGMLEGANGFEYMARNMVYIAKMQYNLNIEVWGMDRRNNCIEDLTGAQAAEQLSDPDQAVDLAIDYYYHGKEINGKTFDGFLTSDKTPYLSEFGLKMDTEDMFTIIETMIPDQAMRKQKVFVGGHSMGGMHTSLFAGWDLDGNPETLDDAGFNNTAAIFCLDSTLSPLDYIVDGVLQEYLGAIPQSVIDFGKELTEGGYKIALRMLRNDRIPRFVDARMAKMVTGSPLDPEIYGVIEILAQLADIAPDQECTAIDKTPISENMDETLRVYMARDEAQLDSGVPYALDFRFTNEALLGIFFDDDFTNVEIIRVSMGFLQGGAVIPKDPDLGYEGLYVPADAGPDLDHLGQGPLYTWANFDEVASTSDPLYQDVDQTTTFTTYTDEMVDIQDFARALHAGDSNLIEWYFSVRRMVDMMAVIMDYGKKYGLNYFHSDMIQTLPQLEIIAGDGVGENIGGSDTATRVILDGYNHMDPMFGVANKETYRKNQTIYELMDFAVSNLNKAK